MNLQNERLQQILRSLDVKMDSVDCKTLEEAIEEGKLIHRNFPDMDTQTNQIKYAISRFIWVQFRGLDLDIDVIQRIREITR